MTKFSLNIMDDVKCQKDSNRPTSFDISTRDFLCFTC
jgi:hypothetical protein